MSSAPTLCKGPGCEEKVTPSERLCTRHSLQFWRSQEGRSLRDRIGDFSIQKQELERLGEELLGAWLQRLKEEHAARVQKLREAHLAMKAAEKERAR